MNIEKSPSKEEVDTFWTSICCTRMGCNMKNNNVEIERTGPRQYKGNP